ncbi:unnamed protein product, partial [Brachionus calyciflorus]
ISNSSSSKKSKTVIEIEVFQSNRIIKQEKSNEFLHAKSSLTSVPDGVITVNEDIQEEPVDNFISDDQWLLRRHIYLAVDFIEKNSALRGFNNLTIYNNWKIDESIRNNFFLQESPEINKIFILNVNSVHWIVLTNINPQAIQQLSMIGMKKWTKSGTFMTVLIIKTTVALLKANKEAFKLYNININKNRINQLFTILESKELEFELLAKKLNLISFKQVINYLKNNESLSDNTKIYTQEINRFLNLSHDNLNIKVNDNFEKYLQQINIENSKILKKDEAKIVFVMASDKTFYETLKHSIKLKNKYFPKRQLVIFDMGMKDNMIEEIKELCKCEVRNFDKNFYSKFSTHFSNLQTYSWKPIIIQEVLNEIEKDTILFYMDTSIKLKSNQIGNLIERTNSYGISTRYLDLKLSCFTDSRMFEWFGETSKQYSDIQTLEANLIVLKKNFLTSLIMKAWVTCAFDENCIAPKGSSIYGGLKNWFKGCHACGCHRFDQDAFTIVNTFFYNFTSQKRPVIALTDEEMLFFDVKRRFYEK